MVFLLIAASFVIIVIPGPSVLFALISDPVWAIIAGSARKWFATNPKRLARLSGVGGGMMIGLGGVLLLTGNKR